MPTKTFSSAWALICLAFTCLTFSCLMNATANAQDDAVYRFRAGGNGSSKISGKITNMTPAGVTIQSNSGSQEVPAAEIDKVVYSDEPLEVGRARDRMETGRFDDAIAELQKISEPARSPAAQSEVDYINAAATAHISLAGGGFTAQEAGKVMLDFVNANQSSYHFYPSTELLGKLFMSVGRVDLAEKEFAKLTQSQWSEYVLRGNFYQGDALIMLGKPDEAAKAYQAIQAIQANDDLTQTYKLLAQVQLAKAQALAGQTAEGIAAIEKIIKVENPDDTKLFAYAYNALGAAQMKAGNLKEAATAYLHTELLYTNEAEPHAEALFNLASIWPQLEQTDRASRARETLKSRYRNSYWSSKL